MAGILSEIVAEISIQTQNGCCTVSAAMGSEFYKIQQAMRLDKDDCWLADSG